MALVAPAGALAYDNVTETPEASKTPEVSDTHATETPHASETPKVSKTPRPSETPEISVPPTLRGSANRLVHENEDVTKIGVSTASKSVEVNYRLHAKLFGLIDLPYELQAKVDTKAGTITAHAPWWLLFARDNAGAVQTALQDNATLKTATNQGQILSTIISILKSLAK